MVDLTNAADANWLAEGRSDARADSSGLRIVGKSGERYLLVDASLPTDEPPPAETQARILDAREGVLYAPHGFHTITAHVPEMNEYEGDEGELEALLEDATVEGEPLDG